MATIPVLVALLALICVAGADAATQRDFKETFGSVAQPSFSTPVAIAVDDQTGDVLVAERGTQTLRRFHADGTPAPFVALGSNVIDGKEANGKPCSEEPASCDKTPQNGIKVGEERETEIAIDESGGPTDGDIYLSQYNPHIVNIFASDGEYLGQLTEVGGRPLQGRGGVAVDGDGTVYIGDGTTIHKFTPTSNPVTNTDLVTTLEMPISPGSGGRLNPELLAMGSGPTASSLFVAFEYHGSRHAAQIDKETGQLKSEIGQSFSGWGIAVDPNTGNVMTGDGVEYEMTGASPERVSRIFGGVGMIAINGSSEVLSTRGSSISVYGLPTIVPTVTTEPPSEVGGTKVTITGTINALGLPLSGKECVFQYGPVDGFGTIQYTHEVACEGIVPADSAPHPVHATISGLEANGHAYGFRLVAFNANGQEETEGQKFTTAATVATEPASALGQTTATLNGVVRPEGSAYTACFFEYGLSSSRSFEAKAPCNPGASALPADFLPHEVKAALTGLRSGTTYRYRLVATNAALGTLAGEEQTFSTFGLPRIEEVHASGADQSSVTLEARINPSGFGTAYRFEWGQTPAYGNLAPVEFEPFIGSGTESILVKAKISGLVGGSTYHYRVTATSSRGTTASADQIAETLNSCGLPEGRCFELVSRSEAGPVALPGEANSGIEMHFQAATGGPGALAYPVEGGYPEATKGAEVQYRATRGAGGWTSTQLSPPIVSLNERKDGASVSSNTQFLSNDLSCGITESGQPLTTDPSMNLVREEGGSNLYRINPEGSSVPYTGITTLPPENGGSGPSIPNYKVAGASQDCGMVLFSTLYAYPGIPAKGDVNSGYRLYEWDGGTLRNAGVVPGPSGEVTVPALAGGKSGAEREDVANAVSEDGSRYFFTAKRQTSPNPAEIGVAKAIFVREDGRETRDVSLSETAVPDRGAEYQWATANGARVFFTANAGLTAESNSEGTDLYEYDLETEELTDRSVTAAEGGAQVVGFLGASAGGSRVYFASQNQLVPGSGNSRAQNVKDESYSIYTEKEGQISFVGTFNKAERLEVLTENSSSWTSQVSPDGRYLIFESSSHVTGYESHGVREVYLYDAEGASQGTTCVSCRQDGQPSADNRYETPGYQLLNRDTFIANELHPPQFLTEQNGEPRVFFSSPDPLAPGAVAGQNNVYEWSHDQIFRLVSAPEGSQRAPLAAGKQALFGGASDDGSDVYLVTPETLTWQDRDQRLSAYDARIGGGFPEPPAPPVPCRATAENSCQAPSQGTAGTPTPATTADSGAQNLEPQKKHKKKSKAHKRKSKNKKSKANKKSNKKGKKSSKRQANGDRRNGK